MERAFLLAGMALCAFSLWAIARHDWLRLTRPRRKAVAEVVGHRTSWENSARSYAAIYRFVDETGSHEVEDALHSSFPIPEVGERAELFYPEGFPHLARLPRPLMWSAVYAVLLFLMGILTAKALGII